MKKIYPLFLISLLLASTSQAGQHSDSIFYVNPDLYMYVTVNASHDRNGPRFFQIFQPGPAIPNKDYAGPIYFTASNGQNQTFQCVVVPSSALYEQAVDIARAVTSGSLVYARKLADENACNYLSHTKGSTYFD